MKTVKRFIFGILAVIALASFGCYRGTYRGDSAGASSERYQTPGNPMTWYGERREREDRHRRQLPEGGS